MWRILRSKPFIVVFIFACLVIGIGVGFVAYLTVDAVSEAQQKLVINAGTAGLTLAFAGVLGGFLGAQIKMLFDTYSAEQAEADAKREAARQKQSADQVFFRNILDDLKSVYDIVEHARLLIAAHKSAKTYGEQMRRLPDSVVVLHNIRRALRPGYSDVEADIRPQIDCCIGFLKDLMAEFRAHYLGASVRQQEYEARKQGYLDRLRKGEDPGEPPDPAKVWAYLEELPHLAVLRSDEDFTQYEMRFLNHIDAASYALRGRLPGGAAERDDPVAQERARLSSEFHARWRALGRDGATAGAEMASRPKVS